MRLGGKRDGVVVALEHHGDGHRRMVSSARVQVADAELLPVDEDVRVAG